MKVSVSLLGINKNIKEATQALKSAGVDSFHIDVMDGEFVERNTVNEMIEKIEAVNDLGLDIDVHLMCKYFNLKNNINLFSRYNVNTMGIHIEEFKDKNEIEIIKFIEYIKYLGKNPCIVINPETKEDEIFKYLKYVNRVLVMTVHPGEGGRPFEYDVIKKIENIKKYIESNKLDTKIEIDGSVNNITRRLLNNADILVSGTYLTNSVDKNYAIKEKIKILKGETNMLVNTKEMLQKAHKEGYAVGAFNISDMESLQGIIKASNELKSPVILQTSKSAIEYMGIDYIYKMVEAAVKNSDIEIALHLDHGANFEICKKAIDNGWTSVMIDASSLPFDENVKLTKQVVEYAHPRGVTVEAELGTLAGVEDEVNVSSDDAIYTHPEDAKRFVELTGVDSLAIAIGTSHGAYKFKGEAKLRMDILKEVRKLLPDTPIVLHGASSVIQELVQTINKYGGELPDAKGMPDEMLKEAAIKGVSKINVDTDLRLAMTSEVRKFLAENKSNFAPRDYGKLGREKIYEVVKHKQKDVFLSKGMSK